MLSWRSRSKTTIQAFCNANLSFHRNACSRSLRDCSACRRAKSDKRLGSHLVYRQRSRGTRPGCLCDDQPTGYNIYQFRKRIPQTNVRWIYFGRVQNSDRSATHYDMIQGKIIGITGTIQLRDGKREIEIVSADQIKG